MPKTLSTIGLRRPLAAIALVATGLGFVVAGSTGASAQAWKAEWDKTVAAAKKEGLVVLVVQPNRRMRAYVSKRWAKDYPGIKLSMNVVRGSQFIARIKQERAAGKKLWDGGFGGAPTGYVLAPQGIVEPFLPVLIRPDVKDPKLWGGWDNAFYDLKKKYVMSISSFLKSPYYNTKYVSSEKVKKLGFDTLLDPAYKGKIYWHDPSIRGSGRSYSFVLRRAWGDEKLKKFIKDQEVVFVPKQSDITEALAREKAWITIGPIVTSLLEPYQKAGVKINVKPFGNTPEVTEMSTGGSTVYVFEGRPHPNATKVFFNWLLSKSVSTGLAKAMHQTWRRTDVPSPVSAEETPIPGKNYLNSQRQEYAKDVAAAIKFVAKVRAEK